MIWRYLIVKFKNKIQDTFGASMQICSWVYVLPLTVPVISSDKSMCIEKSSFNVLDHTMSLSTRVIQIKRKFKEIFGKYMFGNIEFPRKTVGFMSIWFFFPIEVITMSRNVHVSVKSYSSIAPNSFISVDSKMNSIV